MPVLTRIFAKIDADQKNDPGKTDNLRNKPMRVLLELAENMGIIEKVLMLPVDDKGVVTDFDDPTMLTDEKSTR